MAPDDVETVLGKRGAARSEGGTVETAHETPGTVETAHETPGTVQTASKTTTTVEPALETPDTVRGKVEESVPATIVDDPDSGETSGLPVSARLSQLAYSPESVMRRDELERTHTLGKYGLVIIIAGLAVLPMLAGDADAKRWLAICLCISATANMFLLYITAVPERYTDARITIVWTVHAITIAVSINFYGVFSPVPVVTVLVTYWVALAHSQIAALMFYGVSAGAQLLLSVLVITGTMSDRGLVRSDNIETDDQLLLQALVQLILIIALVVARGSRKQTLEKVSEMSDAVRAIAQREVLLQEARQELERALRSGADGRFTGHTLGSFELGAVIGRGAMGEVYEAVRLDTDQHAAVKVLQLEGLKSPSMARRFLRELLIAASVESPNVVRVLEVGDETSEFPYLAMERLRGSDLRQWLRKHRHPKHEDIVEMVRQIGRGITAASEAGIVHRDLKPQNVFRSKSEDGTVVWKVLDFGVSKPSEATGTLTQGHIIGTPVYMAPEQALSHDVDHRTDLYALAAIAYRALTGRLPFSSRGIPNILHDVVYRMPVRPTLLAALPEDMDLALAIGLAKSPDDRFQTADQLADALAAAIAGGVSSEIRRRAERLLSDRPWDVPTGGPRKQ